MRDRPRSGSLSSRGVAVVVWRRGKSGAEWLVLHRVLLGPDYAGDWAWGPPGGACEPGETRLAGARRELEEETGLALDCLPTGCGSELVVVFQAEAPPAAAVELSSEHDAYEWLPLDEARHRCLPAFVGEQFACVACALGEL